jgi:hypothetical protein
MASSFSTPRIRPEKSLFDWIIRQGNMTERRKVAELKPGPIQHPELPVSLVARIEALNSTLAEVYPQSIETWLDGFQRDLNPEPEVVWWERLAQCYVEYSRRNELSVNQKKAAFNVILKLALGSSEINAELDELPESALDEIEKIMRRPS